MESSPWGDVDAPLLESGRQDWTTHRETYCWEPYCPVPGRDNEGGREEINEMT